jgi:hypothetical protein
MSWTWDELEGPVLQWALSASGDTGVLPYDGEEPFAAIPGLTKPDVPDAIARLEEHGLVASASSSSTMGYRMWFGVRPTADGLRVLGEWPPAESSTVNDALVHILRALADSAELSTPEQTAARRAAGTIAITGGDLVFGVVKDEMTRLITGGDS